MRNQSLEIRPVVFLGVKRAVGMEGWRRGRTVVLVVRISADEFCAEFGLLLSSNTYDVPIRNCIVLYPDILLLLILYHPACIKIQARGTVAKIAVTA